MWVAEMRLPPTAFAMSYRSVVLVTTRNWASAGAAMSAAPASEASMNLSLLSIYVLLPAVPDLSEWMGLVGTEREGRLKENAIEPFAAGRRHETLVRCHQLGELARKELEVRGCRFGAVSAVFGILQVVEACAQERPPRDLVSAEDVRAAMRPR